MLWRSLLGTVCRYSMTRIVACGRYMGCYGGSRDPEPDPKPGCGQENNGCGGWTYYRYAF